MAYIYKITNIINQKIYIGKTNLSIEARYKQHCYDAFKQSNEKRPLYFAMRKYGLNNFRLDLVEETDFPDEREKYWIDYYDSFHNGYNATLGGEGKSLINYNEIYNLFLSGKDCTQISVETGHDKDWISTILKEKFNVDKNTIKELSFKSQKRIVYQMDDNFTVISSFPSVRDAATNMVVQGKTKCKISTAATHISEVANGKRQHFAGYRWKY